MFRLLLSHLQAFVYQECVVTDLNPYSRDTQQDAYDKNKSILILLLGFYSGLSGRVRTVYLFGLLLSLLSSRFTVSALVWFFNFLKYMVFHVFISLRTKLIYRCS
jgi:hypothetical protein